MTRITYDGNVDKALNQKLMSIQQFILMNLQINKKIYNLKFGRIKIISY